MDKKEKGLGALEELSRLSVAIGTFENPVTGREAVRMKLLGTLHCRCDKCRRTKRCTSDFSFALKDGKLICQDCQPQRLPQPLKLVAAGS